MNLRNYPGDYSIGLDMGTGSVGWAVTDDAGKLLHFKKQPTWGSRLFDSAQPASEARVHRGQRRRYVRRRWRLDLLQELFKPAMDEVDPTFFMRLNQSRTIEGDPIFASDFTKKDYYDRFPTIYHLRCYLMETEDQADLRLVYLALHNIVKHRGNFLRQGEKLSAKTANTTDALTALQKALENWCVSREYELGKTNLESVAAVLREEQVVRKKKADGIASYISIDTSDPVANKKLCKAIGNAMVGLTCEFKDIFGEFESETSKFAFSDDEKLEALRAQRPDDSEELLDALFGAYSAFVLQGLLSYAEGQTISHNMVAKYDQYANDLAMLKALVREYVPEAFDSFFRGLTYHASNRDDSSKNYNASKAQGYTAYDLHKLSYDDFSKSVKKLLGSTAAASDERYLAMMDAFDKQRFLRRLKTSDNGAIYYQLHLEELQAIIENQGRFYPFLVEERTKLESLVTFRIPYYVGPLTPKNAAKDSHGNNRFQWSERKPGMEDAVITPWNWESVIDKNKSAENFIMRMTGDCTYLAGEKVLPKQSLLYEEFCVLNELNGVWWTEDGDYRQRLDAAQREGIVHELFHKKRSVSYKMIEEWLVREGDATNPHVNGGQGESGLESKMSSYFFFAKDIFGVDELSPSEYPVIEKIILWNTLFEDRSILKEKLEGEFGPHGNGMLSAVQIKKICGKRLTGWGRLSKKFLTGIKVDTQTGRAMSIMDVLREGNPNTDRRRGETMVMVEILHDESLGFQQKIDETNRMYYAGKDEALGVNELPGSPAIRRSLNQAIRIVDEVAHIAGHAPANIFIEVTRDEDEKNKGKRTTKRWDRIEEALKKFKEEGGMLEVMDDFKEQKNAGTELDERLTLYLMQNGKCLYSGRPINLNKLLAGSGEYEVDHIIPRAYIKDDSFENKALVYREENQRKTDQMLIDPSVRRKMSETWKRLNSAGLIGDKKYRNLQRSELDKEDRAIKGFIARQLVETSQMVKMAQALLKARYWDAGTKIVPVKASMSHNLREAAGFIKCREANDFHHAHDAYLACRLGLFIQMRHSRIYDHPIEYAHQVKNYVREQSEVFKRTHRMPGSAGFIVNSFMSSGFDKETGEVFKDAWDAEAEVEGIRRALNYRQCYISRMPYEDSGAFWNANPISKRKNPKLRLKSDLDASRFGGYDSKNASYFFIYEVADKKDKRSLRLAQMPIYLNAHGHVSDTDLDSYCRKLVDGTRSVFIRVVIPCLLKWQLVEIDGSRLYINAEEEVKSGSELAFSQEELRSIKEVVDAKPGEEGPYDYVYCALRDALKRSSCGMLSSDLSLDDRATLFSRLPLDEKRSMLVQLLALCIGNKKSVAVNLTSIGGKKASGRLRPMRYNVPDGLVIIDQSVTGMFERRTRVGL